MKINVQLFGSLGRKIPNYDHSVGVDLDVNGDATVKDVLMQLNVPNQKAAVVLREGNVLKLDDRVFPGNVLVILETFSGG